MKNVIRSLVPEHTVYHVCTNHNRICFVIRFLLAYSDEAIYYRIKIVRRSFTKQKFLILSILERKYVNATHGQESKMCGADIESKPLHLPSPYSVKLLHSVCCSYRATVIRRKTKQNSSQFAALSFLQLMSVLSFQRVFSSHPASILRRPGKKKVAIYVIAVYQSLLMLQLDHTKAFSWTAAIPSLQRCMLLTSLSVSSSLHATTQLANTHYALLKRWARWYSLYLYTMIVGTSRKVHSV